MSASRAYRQKSDTKANRGQIPYPIDQSVTHDQLIVNPLVVVRHRSAARRSQTPAGRPSRGVHAHIGQSATSTRLARSFRASQ